MKYIALVLCLAVSARSQQIPDYPVPLEQPYPAQITLRVKNDNGDPVPNIKVGAATFFKWKLGEGFGQDIHQQYSATTDADGIAVIRAESKRGDFGYSARDTPGFYRDYGNQFKLKEVKDGRWEPWNPVIDVILKPILKPIPLYARKVGDGRPFEIPELHKSFGFDLEVGDWVAPHGKGRLPDLIFTLKELVPFTAGTKPFDYVLSVTFPNEGDGIQSVFAIPHRGSDLRLPRNAPEGGYAPKLEKQMAIFAEGKPMKYDTREDQNYFFRVRTILDEQGRVKSALYGKIAGDIKFGVNRVLRFNYYLNPTSLDRNLEFDPKRNLFTRLRSLEEINEP